MVERETIVAVALLIGGAALSLTDVGTIAGVPMVIGGAAILVIRNMGDILSKLL